MSRSTDRHQVSFLPPEVASIIHLVRENLRLLSDLNQRYEVAKECSPDRPGIVRDTADLAAYLGPELGALAQEQLRVVILNSKNLILAISLVYQGGLNSTVIRLADLFREPVALGATAVVLVYNHPSGDPTPSSEDIQMTEEAARAADLLGIELLDHLTLARGGRYVSLRERGLYSPISSATSKG